MTIKEYRFLLKMTQQEFSQNFGIPIATVRNWEQEFSKPPAYVYTMLTSIIRRDKLINVETIKFVRLLDDLAKTSLNGISPFENASEKSKNNIFYDSNMYDEDGYFVVYWSNIRDHYIHSYYDSITNGYKVRVVLNYPAPVLRITLLGSRETIIIHDGIWEFEDQTD